MMKRFALRCKVYNDGILYSEESFMIKVNVFYKTPVPAHLRRTGVFVKAVSAALGKRAGQKETNIIFVGPAEMRRINRDYLGHDYVTDVVTFPYGETDPETYGDIFICYQIARKNAPLYNHTVLQEMLMYAAHGALHLTGMDDASPEERSAMDKKTLKIISEIL